jgi:Peptidase family M23
MRNIRWYAFGVVVVLAALSAAVAASQGAAAPEVTFSVEPVEDDALLYLPIAAEKADKNPKSQISLRLAITNQEAKAVQLEKVELTFTGPPPAAAKSITVKLKVGPKKTAIWNNSSEHNFIVPNPPPKTAHIHLYFAGYEKPVTVSKALKAHVNPTKLGSYFFPGKVADLRAGEYWTGSSGHAAGNQGSQLFAYDLGVIAFDRSAKSWSELLPGANGSKNEHYRIWGKPVHAMANGKILEAIDDVPNNPHPLKWKTDAELEAKSAEQREKYWGKHTNGGAGNHYYIQHGSEVVLYAHLQLGSLPKALLVKDATVKAGDFLGLAGNTGSSSGPHLHIHAIKGTKPEVGPLRPLPFHDIYVGARSDLHPPTPTGPWVKVNGMGLPAIETAIWPGASKPGSYPKEKK